jgi:hypothetical protein
MFLDEKKCNKRKKHRNSLFIVFPGTLPAFLQFMKNWVHYLSKKFKTVIELMKEELLLPKNKKIN